MEENCLICYDKCRPDFNTYLTQNPDLKADVCNLVCEIYKLSNKDLILDLKNYFNFCQLCFDDLTRVDRIFKSLKKLQESLKNDREELDKRIRESHKRFRIVPAKNRVINSVRDEIIRKIAASENVQTPSESYGFETRNEDEPEGIIISNEISQEEDPFQNLDDFGDDLNSILDGVLKEEEEKELEIPEAKFSIINDPEPILPEPQINLKKAILILPKLPESIQEHPTPICINDPSIRAFVKQESLSSSPYLKRQQNTILPKALYKCFFCTMVFNNQVTLFHHRKKYHKDDLYPCTELHCKEKFKTLANLKIHKLKVHSITEITCHFCHSIFNNLQTFMEHKRSLHSKALFVCPGPNCGKEFARKHRMNVHIKEYHPNLIKRRQRGAQIQMQIIPRINEPLPPPQNSDFEILQPEIDPSTRPKPLYKCFFCPEYFHNLPSQFLHRKKYHKDDLFGCSEPSCTSQFNTLTALKTHLRKDHNIYEYECCFCLGIYSSQSDLTSHKKQEHQSTLFICPEASCSKEFAKKANLNSHLQVKHPSKEEQPKFPCNQIGCGRVFVLRSQLRHHIRQIHEPDVGISSNGVVTSRHRSWPCTIEGCSAIFQTRGGRSLHLEVHRSNKWLCEGCLISFGHREALEKHEEICTGVGDPSSIPFKVRNELPCPECSKIFVTNQDLRIHLRKVHGGRIRVPILKDSSKIKPSPSPLKREMVRPIRNQVDRKRTNWLCEFCSKIFKDRSNFKQHLRNQHPPGQRISLICSNCSKSFMTKHGLKEHFNQIHLKLHNHYCDQCGLGYYSLGQLNSHRKTHFLTLTCSLCPMKFYTKQNRRIHELSHSSEKTFKCPQCPASFKRPGGLHRHKVIQHSPMEVYPFVCEKCGQKFKMRDYLRKHIRLKRCKGK